MPKLRFLAKGCFPKEIPPNFSTSQCAHVLRKGVPSTFPALKKLDAEAAKHSLARMAGTRRILSLPNPILHYYLSTTLEAHWSDIKKHINQSKLSASRPSFQKAQGRAVIPKQPLGDLPILRIQNRFNGKYLLTADVAEFYQSVYTHSIPWALHGKEIAKKKENHNNPDFFGNLLDKAIRSAQLNQTKGIPIGPDSSLIIAEIILAAVDEELDSSVKQITGFRYYDDYELVFSRKEEADRALVKLESILSKYELNLNPQKTGIHELPLAVDRTWLHFIKDFNFGWGKEKVGKIIRYFDEVFETYNLLKSKNKDVYVIGYSISRVESERWDDSMWPIVERLLCQAVLCEPSAMPQFAALLTKVVVDGISPSKKILRNLLEQVIISAAPLGHSSEVVWALWTSIALDIKIGVLAAEKISQMNDSVVALLALDARDRGLIGKGLKTDYWTSLMNEKSLYSGSWLLAYEANVRGWLKSHSADYIDNDPGFSVFKENEVRFYSAFKKVTKSLVKKMTPKRGRSYGDWVDDDDNDDDDDDDTTWYDGETEDGDYDINDND